MRPTSLRHSSQTCSSAPLRVAENCSPMPELRFLPSAIPISSTETPRPSLRPIASAITAGAWPRGCWPRSQRATEVLSYRRSRPCSAPHRFTRRARPAFEQLASWMSCCRRSLGCRATSGLAAMGFASPTPSGPGRMDDDSADLLPTVRPSKESDTRLAISNASGIPTVTVLTPRAPGRMPPCAPTAPGPPQLRQGALTGSGDIAAPGHTSSRRAVTSLTDGS